MVVLVILCAIILSMTDEELAELMYEVDIREGATDLEGWVDWLKQPYKEESE